MARRACSLAASALLHLIALIVVASQATPPRVATPSPKPRAVEVFVAPPRDDSGPAGLNPLEPTDHDLIRREDGSGTVKIPGFEYSVAKIEARATLLFPFVTPVLSIRPTTTPRRSRACCLRSRRGPAAIGATWTRGPRRGC
jgi:hypothetical protein